MTLATVGATTVPTLAEPGEPPLPPAASFTYNLSRYHDRGGDAFPDPARTSEEAQPSGFGVSLDGCASSPGRGQGARYTWNINGVQRGPSPDCDLHWTAPAQGSYPVSLTVETPDGNSDSQTQLVTVKDLVVVSIGDSLGSGQGNPHTPQDGSTPAVWEDRRCHRSETAGSAQAARALEAENPRTSITFVHLACSGAKIADPLPTQGGLLDQYEGQDDAYKGAKDDLLPPQLDEVERLLGDRRIDALMLSVGINDVEFATIVFECIDPRVRQCDRQQRPLFERRLDLLSNEQGHGGRYEALAGQLSTRFPELALDPSKVFINEYPDPTHAHGQVCPSMLGGQITSAEMAWTSTVVPKLNQRVHAAAGVHRWTTVDGVREQYLNNGECNNDDHWFVQAHESQWNQGNIYGTLHPNAKGHAPLRDRFLDKIRPKLPATAPGIVVNGLAPMALVAPGAAPTVFVHDPTGVTASSVTLDGAPYASGTPINGRGPHTLVVNATNTPGLQSVLTISFTVVPTDLTFSVSPGTVQGGTTATATVVLKEQAPYPGVEVALRSSRPGVASVPVSVTVPTGSTTGSAIVSASPVGTDTTVTLTAEVAGISRTANLVVTAPRVKSVAMIPNQVAGGDPAAARVSLTGPAPAGGINVNLTSANPAVVRVPASWAVPATDSFVDVPLTTAAVATETSVVVTASLGGTAEATLRVFPKTVVVPLVQDMSGVVAVRILHEEGLEVVQHPAELNGNPNAWVVSQSPAAGTTVAFGSTVTLTLRLGPVN